jgi:eukaryotic-like serine/threonine-protein kinase
VDGPFDITVDDAKKAYPEYKFIKRLAKSAQKAAFQVQDATGQELCLKIISPAASLDRVQREIEALRSLNHPNIVRLHHYELSVTSSSTRHFAVEEYIPGKDLADLLIEGCPWSLKDVATLFRPLADGLFALGSARIVHRDLKPSNIRVKPDMTPVIVDLGVARLLDLADLTSTSAGTAIGTVPYFAPEQFEGKKLDIDPRTDLFALGVMLHEAILGRHPFLANGISLPEFQERVCRSSDFAEAADFKAIPIKWRVLVRRLLEKPRVRRPKDAGMVRDLIVAAAGPQ